MIDFFPETHEYFLDGKPLLSVTALLKKHGLAPDYSSVPDDVLTAKSERGTLIHAELEKFIKSGEIGFTEEVFDFAEKMKEDGIHPLESEKIVYNDLVAGTLDFLYEQDGKVVLADFKTTAVVHKDAVSWQLSIYKTLLEGMTEYRVDAMKVFHFSSDGLHIIDVCEKPAAEVERLFDCERAGERYSQEVTVPENALAELAEVETLIKSIEEARKNAQERAEALRGAIMQAMKQNAVSTFENDALRITYVAPFVRSSVDSAKLKAERPEIYEKYLKKTTVKESLKITIKE